MKKLVFAFIIIIVSVVAGVSYFKKSTYQTPPVNKNVLSESEISTATIVPRVWKQSIVIDADEIPIRISWTIVQPKDVKLYSNLEEQKLSEEIKVNKSCQVLVNGGFYSEDQTHLGFFVSNFEIISKFSQNALLNGFMWINTDNNIIISTDLPDITPRWGMQTGPLLIKHNQPLPLAINNDEPNRRIVAGNTPDNKLIFLAFYKDHFEYEGPMLEKLPAIIKMFEKQTNIKIINAINLDGGTHSVFVSNYDLLRELKIIGSYFCIK